MARVETQLNTIISEKELKKLNANLDEKVKERTKALIASNEKLNDYNTALKVVMEKREEDRAELEEKISANVEELILPSITRLKQTRLTERQKELLKICEENILKITSSFINGIKNDKSVQSLTHKETTIANLIVQGKSSQEISTLLNSSESTINFHRKNIRKKLGIKNKSKNLQIYLKQLESQRQKRIEIN